jgi:diketogulonate reductase-like aldo/keto reductase
VITRGIPSSGEQLPVIGLGTWQTFDVGHAAEVREVLEAFVPLGGKLIDSSPMYGRSESVVGELIESHSPDQFFVATKVWTSASEAASSRWSPPPPSCARA